MTERDLDNEIDRAVRDMMAVDTGAAFRARVLERLDHARPRRFWPALSEQASARVERRSLALAAAATVILVVAVMMTRTPESVPVTQRTVNNAPPVATAPAERARGGVKPGTRHVTAERRDPVSKSPGNTSTNRARQVAARLVVATVTPPETTVEIEPLQVIDPITVAPLNTPRIEAQEIVVAPLAPIVEMQIAPLSPRTERD